MSNIYNVYCNSVTLRDVPDTRTPMLGVPKEHEDTDDDVCSGAFMSHQQINLNTVRASPQTSCGRDLNAPSAPYEEHHTVSHSGHACVRLRLKHLSRCVML